MVIRLYNNQSDPKTVDKSLIGAITVSGTARDPLNMTDPVIDVEGNINSIGQYNYMYIEDYARYYFIDITADSYNLNTITGHVDILSSSKNWLRSRYATITRNERLYNSYLNDPDFKSYAYTNIVTKAFPNGITADSIVLMTVG